jgi:hypothetical protein
MNLDARTPGGGGATLLGCVSGPARETSALSAPSAPSPKPSRAISPDLTRALAEVKGQAQFLLYLADQIEESLGQLAAEGDPGHAAFLGKLLSMYSAQMETKHQGLGDRIAETCQEVYVTVREFDVL